MIGTITPVDINDMNRMVSEFDAGKADLIGAMDVILNLFEIRELFEKRFELLKPGILDAAQRLFDRINQKYGQTWVVKPYDEIEDEDYDSVDYIDYPKVTNWGNYCNCPLCEIKVINAEGVEQVVRFFINDREGRELRIEMFCSNSLIYEWLGITDDLDMHPDVWMEPITL